MFNCHLSLSLLSQFIAAKNWYRMNLGIFSAAALSVTWPGLVELIKLTSLAYFIANIKQRQILHTHKTHTDIHIHRQTYCLLLQTNNCNICRFLLKGVGL